MNRIIRDLVLSTNHYLTQCFDYICQLFAIINKQAVIVVSWEDKEERLFTLLVLQYAVTHLFQCLSDIYIL